MAAIVRTERWNPWAGTVSLLREVTEMCMAELQGRPDAAIGEGADAPDLEITVYESGFTAHLDSPEELTSLVDERDLDRISSFEIQVGRPHGGDGIRLRGMDFMHTGGLELLVRGSDRTWVEGVITRVCKLVEPRERLALPHLNRGNSVFVGFFVGMGLALALAPIVRSVLDIEPRGVRLAIVFGTWGLSTAAFGVLGYAQVPLELLPAGQQPRFQRWKKRLIAWTGIAVSSIVLSIIAAAIYSGD